MKFFENFKTHEKTATEISKKSPNEARQKNTKNSPRTWFCAHTLNTYKMSSPLLHQDSSNYSPSLSTQDLIAFSNGLAWKPITTYNGPPSKLCLNSKLQVQTHSVLPTRLLAYAGDGFNMTLLWQQISPCPKCKTPMMHTWTTQAKDGCTKSTSPVTSSNFSRYDSHRHLLTLTSECMTTVSLSSSLKAAKQLRSTLDSYGSTTQLTFTNRFTNKGRSVTASPAHHTTTPPALSMAQLLWGQHQPWLPEPTTPWISPLRPRPSNGLTTYPQDTTSLTSGGAVAQLHSPYPRSPPPMDLLYHTGPTEQESTGQLSQSPLPTPKRLHSDGQEDWLRLTLQETHNVLLHSLEEQTCLRPMCNSP